MTPWSIEALVEHAERRPDAAVCDGSNWQATIRGLGCHRMTRWVCTRCGERVCPAHAKQHQGSNGVTGRRECERKVCEFRWPDPERPWWIHGCTIRNVHHYQRGHHECSYNCGARHDGEFVAA